MRKQEPKLNKNNFEYPIVNADCDLVRVVWCGPGILHAATHADVL